MIKKLGGERRMSEGQWKRISKKIEEASAEKTLTLKSGITRGTPLGRWVLVGWVDGPPALALVLGKDDDQTLVWFPFTNEWTRIDAADQIVWIGPEATIPTLPKFDRGFRLK